jgi:hypothetical protein
MLVVAGLLLAACGVSFREAQHESELLTSLTIAGQPAVSQEVTAVLEYQQVYPVSVQVNCYLDGSDETGLLVAKETIAASADDSSLAEAVPGELTFRFPVDEPGKHSLECLTPEDSGNTISTSFEVQESMGSAAN